MKFDSAMNGLRTFHALFHSSEASDLSLYNGWNFTDASLWDSLTADSFWYSDASTLLFSTDSYMIGS